MLYASKMAKHVSYVIYLQEHYDHSHSIAYSERQSNMFVSYVYQEEEKSVSRLIKDGELPELKLTLVNRVDVG